MSDDAWEQLVKRYANGRTICNCGDAYVSPGEKTGEGPHCRGGCSANKIFTRDELAELILRDLKQEHK